MVYEKPYRDGDLISATDGADSLIQGVYHGKTHYIGSTMYTPNELENNGWKITILQRLLTPEEEVVQAAMEWVNRIDSDPRNWADNEDLKLINAVQQYQTEHNIPINEKSGVIE